MKKIAIGILLVLLIFSIFFFLNSNFGTEESNLREFIESGGNNCEEAGISILGQDCSNNSLKIFVKNDGPNNLNQSFIIFVFTTEMQLIEGKILEIERGEIEEIEVEKIRGIVKNINIQSNGCSNVQDSKTVSISCS